LQEGTAIIRENSKEYPMIHNPKHPLITTLINTLRDTTILPIQFRQTIREISKILLYEAMKDSETIEKKTTTWRGEHNLEVIPEDQYVVVSILRAGLSMHDSIIETLDESISGFLGMRRDEITHKSVLYYDRVSDCNGKTVLLLDPMVATGGSLGDAIDVIKAKGAKKIITLNIIGAPEGIETVLERHPDITMVIAQIDERLDENKFIIPGLGDAGDRAYNTPE